MEWNAHQNNKRGAIIAKTFTLKVRMEEFDHAKYKAEADRQGMTLGAFVRKLLAQACNRPKTVNEARTMIRETLPSQPEPERQVVLAAHRVKTRERSHDTSSCRLYGCLQCRAAGIEDKRRGL